MTPRSSKTRHDAPERLSTIRKTTSADWVEARGTQRVGAFTQLPALMRQLGADPEATLALAGLPPDALASPERTIPYPALGTLLARIAERTACPHVGLLAGRMWHMADLGLLGEVVRHCPTLGEALRTLTVYQHLNSGGGFAFLVEQGGVVDLGYAIYHARVEGTGLVFDAFLAGGLNFVRELAGPGFALSQVLLSRARPADVAPYRSHFHVVPRFESEQSVLRFPAAWMSRPVAGADPARLAAARRGAEAADRGVLLQQLTRAVRRLLVSGDVSGEAAAQMLAMHRRTLNRRLKAQGATFQAVLDTVRREVACQLLEGTSASLDDIASTLGYAGVTPFMRAFRRWTGVTPGRWRIARRPTSAHEPDDHGAPGREQDVADRDGARIPQHRDRTA
ncbi:MAG: AraC family transcriptional regulator [Burkholderiales bacterium]|nr:AraC family transcriptional regulator [Burkholderiales bacterium]